MNGQFQVAQAAGTGNSNNNGPVRIFKLSKPLGDQAVVVNLGYDQKVQIDFSSIANEKITLVHVGEKLIILFDNQSTVTVEPFFNSRHDALNNLTIEVAPGRDLSVSEFASTFPITTDQSVLPAAGNGNAQASGGNFSNPSVDPLAIGNPLPLLGPEVLPNFQVTNPTELLLPPTTQTTPTPPAGPTIVAGVGPDLVVDESFIPGIGSHVAVAGSPNSNVDTETFAASFTVNAPAGVQSITYALTINNATTNLINSVSGQTVTLVSKGGGEVDGVVTIAGKQTEVFTLTVDSTGHITLTELRGVHENTPDTAPAGVVADSSEGISLAAGLVSLTATVTDNNNATASASEDLGPHIIIHDDGPSIQLKVLGEEQQLPGLTVDESGLPTGSTPSVALTTDTEHFAGAFSSTPGADGATTAYTLAAHGATGTVGVDSGLIELGDRQSCVPVCAGRRGCGPGRPGCDERGGWPDRLYAVSDDRHRDVGGWRCDADAAPCGSREHGRHGDRRHGCGQQRGDQPGQRSQPGDADGDDYGRRWRP